MSAYFESLNRRARRSTTMPVAAEVLPPLPEPAAPRPAPAPTRPAPETPRPVRFPARTATPLPAPALPDAYAALREKLLAGGGGQTLKTILFAGCTGGEGSSQVVREFAETLVGAALDVLVVDAGAPGAGNPELREIITANGAGRLSVVRSPAMGPDKEHYFRTPEFASWLDVQRGKFDYVLLDAPPLLRLADGTLMGRLTDAAIIVIEAEATERGTLVRAREQLRHAGVNVIGVVLNRARNPVPASLQPYLPEE
jgi:Mrp family chromosome partitioning ATPase